MNFLNNMMGVVAPVTTGYIVGATGSCGELVHHRGVLSLDEPAQIEELAGERRRPGAHWMASPPGAAPADRPGAAVARKLGGRVR
jgi:hypothetical protein